MARRRPYARDEQPPGEPSAVRPHARLERRSQPHRAADADGLWLYGRHAVLAAIANPRRTIRRLLAIAAAEADLTPALATAPVPRPAIEIIDKPRLDQLLAGRGGQRGAVHQGIAALVDPLAEVALQDVLETLAPGQPAVVAILDQASDPRNVGAVLRSAAAFGIAAVIVQDRHAPQATAALAKAASGGLEAVPLVRAVNLSRAIETLQAASFWCLGLAHDAPATLPDIILPERLALVLGAEDRGLRRLVRDHCDELARIPTMSPAAIAVDSLNVSVAAAIAFYEVTRRQ